MVRPIILLKLAILSRAVRELLSRWLLLTLIGVICLAAFFSLLARERTFSVFARSLGGEISFEGELNDWRFEKAVICRLREFPDLREQVTDELSPCDSRAYVATQMTDEVVEWRDGSRISWRRKPSGDLQFRILNAETPGMPVGTLIVISREDWQAHGALVFQGVIRLGGLISTGSDDYLIEGEWQALQSGFATSLFRDVTDVVKSGKLIRGSTVDFVAADGPVTSYGHITPHESIGSGVVVALLTENGPLSLRVNYFGLAKPALFKPDWIDTISSSTLLVAVAGLLSILAAVVGAVNALFSLRSRKEH